MKYVIIAGPQAAGKSSIINKIASYDPKVITLEESRKIIVHKYQRKGAIFMTKNDEIEAIHNDMTRMFAIIGQNIKNQSYVDETNVFTISHAKAHNIDLLDGYYKQYIDMLKSLQCSIIFIDVPPEISWDRRKHRYFQRLWDYNEKDKKNTLSEYKQYLQRLYVELNKLYLHIELPKITIDGKDSIDKVARRVIKIYKEIISNK